MHVRAVPLAGNAHFVGVTGQLSVIEPFGVWTTVRRASGTPSDSGGKVDPVVEPAGDEPVRRRRLVALDLPADREHRSGTVPFSGFPLASVTVTV